jgi:hypothetical protein
LADTGREQFNRGARLARTAYREFTLPAKPQDGTVADWDAWVVSCCNLLDGQYTVETVAGTTRRVHVLSATADLVLLAEYDVTTLKYSTDPEEWFKNNIGTAPAIPQ